MTGDIFSLLATSFLCQRRHITHPDSIVLHPMAPSFVCRRHPPSGSVIPHLAASFLIWRRHCSSGGIFVPRLPSLFLAWHRQFPRCAGRRAISPDVTPSRRTLRHLAGSHAISPEVTPARRRSRHLAGCLAIMRSKTCTSEFT